jgi:hypothetical protein
VAEIPRGDSLSRIAQQRLAKPVVDDSGAKQLIQPSVIHRHSSCSVFTSIII